jgi:hypothetical protein
MRDRSPERTVKPVTEHRHRTQLPVWAVFLIVIGFLALLGLGVWIGGYPGAAIGLALAFGFLSLAGAWWGYDSTDGRNWRGPIR